jgi:hypothetical protein
MLRQKRRRVGKDSIGNKASSNPSLQAAHVDAYLMRPVSFVGAEVQNAGCPQDQISSRDSVVIITRGCTEEEAMRKAYRMIIDRAKQLRKDSGLAECIGNCESGNCTLIAPFDDNEIRCVPAEVSDCPDGIGFVCIFIGKIRAECVCAV